METHVLVDRRQEDYVAGVNSPLEYQELLPSGDWTSYLPTPETQRTLDDKANCVTQAHHNCTEGNFHLAITQQKMTQENLVWLYDKGYYDDHGRIDFSEKFNSILNYTTKDGNYLWRVADEARVHGLIPERMLPSNNPETWDQYYNRNQITPAMLQLGEEFLDRFELPYEWVDITVENLMHHLRHAPLLSVLPGHGVKQIKQKTDVWNYFDSYAPYIKERVGVPQVAMKILLGIKQSSMKRVILLEGTSDQYLVEGNEKHKIPDIETQQFLQNKIKIISGFVETVRQPEFDSFIIGTPMPSVKAEAANKAIYMLYKEKLPILQDAYESNK